MATSPFDGMRPESILVAEALGQIGIEVRIDEKAEGFLEAVDIRKGVLFCKPEASASNILHEAGHLACLPPMFRSRANGDLDNLAAEMCDYADNFIGNGGNPEAPIIRAIMQCSDPEATAWAWAFGHELGLTDDQIIDDDDYQGDGVHVRLQVSTGMYVGVNGLRAAGMISSTKNWPKLDKWLQDAEGDEK